MVCGSCAIMYKMVRASAAFHQAGAACDINDGGLHGTMSWRTGFSEMGHCGEGCAAALSRSAAVVLLIERSRCEAEGWKPQALIVLTFPERLHLCPVDNNHWLLDLLIS